MFFLQKWWAEENEWEKQWLYVWKKTIFFAGAELVTDILLVMKWFPTQLIRLDSNLSKIFGNNVFKWLKNGAVRKADACRNLKTASDKIQCGKKSNLRLCREVSPRKRLHQLYDLVNYWQLPHFYTYSSYYHKLHTWNVV